MAHGQLGLIDRRSFLRGVGYSAGGALLMGVVGACGGDDGGSQAGGGGGMVDFTGEIAVAHLQAIIAGAPFLVADELGFFEEEGLTPELVSFPGGTDTVRGIASGIPFGMPATLPGLIAYQAGQDDLRMVSGAVNVATVNFLVPANSDIRSIEDLRGKKIAVSQPGSITTYFANRIVQEQGLVPGEDVEILNVGGAPDAWVATEQGVADVAWSSPPISNSLMADGSARVLFETSEYVTAWVDNTYWTTQEFIDESPEVVEAILRALQKSFMAIKEDPDRAAPAYAARAEIEEQVARSALEQIAPALSLEFDMPGIEENVRAGADLGQLDPNALDLDAIIVRDFVERL
ncbi:ABC transporter substrate-binding protein [Pseudonocardia sichuanensis]